MDPCPSCGAIVDADDRYCATCGVALDGGGALGVDADDPSEARQPRGRRWVLAIGAAALVAAVLATLGLLSDPDAADSGSLTPRPPDPTPPATVGVAAESPTPAAPRSTPTPAATPTPEPLVPLTAAGLGPGRIVLAGDGIVTVYDLETGERWDPPAGSRADNSAVHLVGSTLVTSALSGVGDEVRFIDLDTGSVGVWGDPRNLGDRWPLIVIGSTNQVLIAQLIYAERGSLEWVTIDRETQETMVIEFPVAEPGIRVVTPGDAIVVSAGSQLVRIDGDTATALGRGRIVTASEGAILVVDCDDEVRCMTRSIAPDGTVLAQGPVFELPAGIGAAPVLSPDGRWVAVWDVPTRTVEVTEVATGAVTVLETGSRTPGRPIWARDSERLIVTDRGELIVVPLDGPPARIALEDTYSQVFLIPPGPLGTG